MANGEYFNMVLMHEGRRIAVYGVYATDEDDARRKIEQDLAPKPHRQSLLRRWIEQGRPVRAARYAGQGRHS